MQMHFYKNDKLIKNINVKYFDDFHYIIDDEDTKMEIITKPDVIITRDNKEAYFKLDITNNACIYKLKAYNLCYDIEIIQKNLFEKIVSFVCKLDKEEPNKCYFEIFKSRYKDELKQKTVDMKKTLIV